MLTREQLQATMQGLFPEVLGVRLTEVSKDRVAAEMVPRDDLCTLPGRIHGGALMAFADTLGAYGTAINLPEGAATTTIESKTNFFGTPKFRTPIQGVSTPLHRGRSTMVWQTKIESEGKLIALVTQTQIVLPSKTAES